MKQTQENHPTVVLCTHDSQGIRQPQLPPHPAPLGPSCSSVLISKPKHSTIRNHLT